MYKLRFFIILLICLLVFPGLSLAAENQTTDKKSVAIIVANDEKDSEFKNEQHIKNLLIDPAIQKFSNRFVMNTDAKYYEKFKSAGLYSIIDLEKNDIIDILKDENIDYAVLIQTLGSDRDAYYTLMYHSQMKVIDLRTNKLLFNGKFCDNGRKPQLDQMLQIMDERLPKN